MAKVEGAQGASAVREARRGPSVFCRRQQQAIAPQF
jgi:hypothetical protein